MPTSSFELFDFSLAAVLSAQGVYPMTSCRGALMPSSMIRTSELPLFQHDLVTHLPCISLKLDLEQQYSTCMIYEEGIVGVIVSPRLSVLYSLCSTFGRWWFARY